MVETVRPPGEVGGTKLLRRRRQKHALINHTSPLIYKTISIFTRFIGNEYSENMSVNISAYQSKVIRNPGKAFVKSYVE